MASTPNTVATLNGLFKEVYADKVKQLIPDGVILLNELPFLPKEKHLGNQFHQPVILAQEHGFSYGGTDGTAFALGDAIAGQVKDAVVQGYEFVLRTQISYGAVSRSMNSAAAFESATKLVVANMLRSFSKRMEIMLMYGNKGLGTVLTNSNPDIVLSAASFAPGIWSGGVNMRVEIKDSTGATSRVVAPITAVNLETRTLTLGTAISGSIASVVATDIIWHQGAYGNEFNGLEAVISLASGNLYGISVTAFDLWKGVTYSAGSTDLSFSTIQRALALAVAKGLDSEVMCLVNPKTWANLMTDQASLRNYDYSYDSKKEEKGSQSITFYSQNGKIEIKPSIYCKEGHAFLLPREEIMRVGSTEITFKRPGFGDEFFRELDSNAGYELRAYSDQSLFVSCPAKCVLINNIVNS